MKLDLENKVAIVLGGSRGLGRAAALELSRENAIVAIGSRRSGVLQETVGQIHKETGNEVLGVATDVTVEGDINNIVRETAGKYGRIDILVNNAGGPSAGGFEDVSDGSWQDAFSLSFMSVVRATRVVLPHMRKLRNGRIINILSTSAKQPIDGLILSNSMRAAVAGLSKSLANELADTGITVNNICPGPFLTDRVKQLHPDKIELSESELSRVLGANVPMKRIGMPDELGSLVAFLASDRSSYMTGTTIQIDGGLIEFIF